MADAGAPASDFKPETIQFVIDSIKEVWLDGSHEKLGALFTYLMSKGVKSEADVESISEAELGDVIGLEAARKILQRLKNSGKEEEERVEENKKTHSETDPDSGRGDKSTGSEGQSSLDFSEAAADSGKSLGAVGSQNEMTVMFRTFMEMQKMEREENRKMIKELQKGMQESIIKVTGSIMNSMKDMNQKLTEQMGLQQQVMHTLSGQIVGMEQRHQETARRTQEWMTKTQEMNQTMLMELTRKVNGALEAKEDSLNELKAALMARPQIVPVPVPSCSIS